MVCTECGVELWDSIERANQMCHTCSNVETLNFFGLQANANDDTDILDAEDDEDE